MYCTLTYNNVSLSLETTQKTIKPTESKAGRRQKGDKPSSKANDNVKALLRVLAEVHCIHAEVQSLLEQLLVLYTVVMVCTCALVPGIQPTARRHEP